MADMPDPPIVPSWHPLARDLLPEKRCQCDKCGDWFPKSETRPRWPFGSTARICRGCLKEEQGDG